MYVEEFKSVLIFRPLTIGLHNNISHVLFDPASFGLEDAFVSPCNCTAAPSQPEKAPKIVMRNGDLTSVAQNRDAKTKRVKVFFPSRKLETAWFSGVVNEFLLRPEPEVEEEAEERLRELRVGEVPLAVVLFDDAGKSTEEQFKILGKYVGQIYLQKRNRTREMLDFLMSQRVRKNCTKNQHEPEAGLCVRRKTWNLS